MFFDINYERDMDEDYDRYSVEDDPCQPPNHCFTRDTFQMIVPIMGESICSTFQRMVKNGDCDGAKEFVRTHYLQLTKQELWSADTNPLLAAITMNKQNLVDFLVKDCSFDLNLISPIQGCLTTAIKHKRWDLAKHMVHTLGANPNIYPGSKKRNPLAFCIENFDGDENALAFVVEELGADVNLSEEKCDPGSIPRTPLQIAFQSDLRDDEVSFPRTKLLLKFGANFQFKTTLVANTKNIIFRDSRNVTFFDEICTLTSSPVFKKVFKPFKCKHLRSLHSHMLCIVFSKSVQLHLPEIKINNSSPFQEIHRNFKMGMVRCLLKNFTVDLNADIILDKKPSTLYIYALELIHFWKHKMTLLFKEGEHVAKEGWSSHLKVFITPLHFARRLGWENGGTPDQKKLFQFLKDQSKKLQPKKPDTVLQQDRSEIFSQHERLEIFKSIQDTKTAVDQLKDCVLGVTHKLDTIFITPEFMSNEQIAIKEAQISTALEVQAEIQTLRSNQSFLDEDEILSLEHSISKLEEEIKEKKSLNEEVECIICYEIPHEIDGNIHAMLCLNDHLLCHQCWQMLLNNQIIECPMCKVDFVQHPPTRNRIVENLIRKLQERNVLSQHASRGKLENDRKKLSLAKELRDKELELVRSENYMSPADLEKAPLMISKALELREEKAIAKKVPEDMFNEAINSIQQSLTDIKDEMAKWNS